MISEPDERNILEPNTPDPGYRPERTRLIEEWPRFSDAFYGAPVWVFWTLMALVGAIVGLTLGARY